MQILFKRGNTASNDAYTGSLGEITIDTQARKIRIHDGATAGGTAVAIDSDISNLQSQIDGLAIADISGLQAALDDLDTTKAEKSTSVTAGNGLTGGGDLSASRTVTLGTPGTINGSSTNAVTATSHTHALDVTKADVGLGNVDNTSDANKPVSTAQQTALDGKVDTADLGVANGVATLDSGGKVPESQLPESVVGALDYQGTWNASTNTPIIPAAATANKGHYYKVATAGSTNIDGIIDWKIGDWIVSNGTSWDKIDNTDSVSSVAGKTGVVTLVKADVGLGNVDNTSDANKPVSTAQQTALDLKADLNSPALTGTPTAPTATAGDNTTKIATTAFVQNAVSTSSGVATLGVTAPIVNTGTAADPVIDINNATTTTDGAMSAADKTKLDGIAAGAEVNTVDSVAGKTGVVTLVKGDVGLGSVDNFATASQAQAQAGTANNVFMTPLRTVELIEAGNFTLDLGTF